MTGTKGQLKSVKKPGGSCAAPGTNSGRKLCVSYTYDGAGRVKTMTDGRGKVTEYQYDRNDQTLRVLFDTNDVACLANLGFFINYGYDAEQNHIGRSVTTKSSNSPTPRGTASARAVHRSA